MDIDFFLLGTALILIHEMDAIRCKEWRIFPLLTYLNDKKGFLFFIFLHIPLLYWILLEIDKRNEAFIYYFDIFLIVHLCLHLLFLLHKKNEFKDWISWILIASAGLCGLIDLLL